MSKPMSDGGKGSVRRNEDNKAYQRGWDTIFGKDKAMIEEDNIEDFDEEYDDTCTWCGGCGEGDYDGAACRRCHGTGVEPCEGVDDDYI
jgi:hypothetical protein